MNYQIHDKHGYHIAYSPQEAKYNESQGWKTVTKEEYYDRGKPAEKAPETSLADEYEAIFGKRPHHRTKEATIKKAIENAKA